jgi:PAS domain S-box-containing protein
MNSQDQEVAATSLAPTSELYDGRADHSYQRLELLYEISKSLTAFDSVEEIFLKILTMVAEAFPLFSATLLEKKGTSFKTNLWPTTGLSDENSQRALKNLGRSYEYLVGLAPAELRSMRACLAITSPLNEGDLQEKGFLAEHHTGNYLVFPLVVNHHPIFGILQLEASRPLDEGDVKFASALSNLVAVALDRFRRAEEERIEFLGAVLDNLEDGIVACDAQGILTTFNGAAQTLHGTIVEGMTLLEWSKASHRFHTDGVTPLTLNELPLYRALHEGSVRSMELVLIPKDRPARVLLCHGRALYDKQGKKIGAVSTHHDITSERNAHVLESAKAELTRSNVELKTFSSTAAHDLNAPLNSIIQCTELLEIELQGHLGPDAIQYMGFIVSAANRMRTLITRLLTYAQVGEKREAFHSVNCETITDEVIANLQAAISDHRARVEKTILPAVLGNTGELSQLFQNLISNALKFSVPERTPEIKVSAQDHGDGKILFSVHDNGIGIAPQFLTKVFEPFKRLHGDSEYEGTGLGLAISQKIVEAHGGKIWAESEPGKGTTMRFTLRKSTEKSNRMH